MINSSGCGLWSKDSCAGATVWTRCSTCHQQVSAGFGTALQRLGLIRLHIYAHAQTAQSQCAVLTDGSSQWPQSQSSQQLRLLAPPGARLGWAVGPLHGTLGDGMLPAAPGVLTLQSWPMSLAPNVTGVRLSPKTLSCSVALQMRLHASQTAS